MAEEQPAPFQDLVQTISWAPCRFRSSLRVGGFLSSGRGGGGDLLPCGEREEHGPRRRLDSKLNRGGDECDADLHAMASPMLFQLAGWPVQRRRPAILFRSAWRHDYRGAARITLPRLASKCRLFSPSVRA